MKRFNLLHTTLLVTLASTCLFGTAYADNALKMELTADQVIKNSEGKITYSPVRTAPAGTIIRYKATYTNTVNKDINDLMVTLPIPANMVFTGEAIPASAQASTDGKNYADIPLMRKIDGKLVKTPLSEYRTLRWNIKLLPANKSAAVAMNTTVN
ncbi:hypothetical protein IPZ60_08755 [Psychrobacter sp. NG25]|uniref:hypothetical protein n=1 Tax=Psychrobacter sp. NG25 TaxID=2782005 RepID=UPI0018846E40|nr:hypothetical protein [Psychrobacter sp. NG25]MBF0658823.1 hypothetical protein [Psychrobacter sp. NG25]